MSSEEPRLGKSLFGYARSAVARILADREIMLRQAEGAARDAEFKAEELEDELEEVRAVNARLDQQMDRLRMELDPAAADEARQPQVASQALHVENGAEDVEEEELPAFSEPISMWDPESTVSDDPFTTVRTPSAPEASAKRDSENGDDFAQDTSSFWAPAEYATAAVRGREEQSAPTRPAEPSWVSDYDVGPGSPDEGEGEEDIPEMLRDDVVPPEPPTRRPEVTSSFSEELAGILAAAEESAAGIVERARSTTDRQITESTRLWREVEAEVARFASWREEVEPVIRRIASKVDDVRVRIEEVPERIREALAPMADSISTLDADMAELAAATTPPLLLKPTGLEERANEVLGSGRESESDFAANGIDVDDDAAAGSEYRDDSSEDVTES